jgi:hypothetical protein
MDLIILYVAMVVATYILAVWTLDDRMRGANGYIAALALCAIWPITAVVGLFIGLGELISWVKNRGKI